MLKVLVAIPEEQVEIVLYLQTHDNLKGSSMHPVYTSRTVPINKDLRGSSTKHY